jgi:hypothetical protein
MIATVYVLRDLGKVLFPWAGCRVAIARKMKYSALMPSAGAKEILIHILLGIRLVAIEPLVKSKSHNTKNI